ncbi:AsmA family protein [Seongchinamella unica]|uniref:AsmA family protein n=1 Tax=Seongchinamella unica TaxID=2547392 RepID=A0A4R5LSS7_9GAMM|nr:AsmA-like C-terminal region-containing protein [Seongchinamella unica]TDG13979.1 AsmA family protein [Seongchinamella unica]
MRKLVILLTLLAVLLLLPLLLMRSEKALLYIAHWAVDTFTNLRLELQQPVLQPLKGRVAASEIHLYPKAEDGPPFLSVLGFEGDTSAGDIYRGDLAGSRLSARQVTIFVSTRDATADPAPLDWLQYLGWLPEELSVEQLHVVTTSHNTLIFPLGEISGKRGDDRTFHATAIARQGGESLGLALDLTTLYEQETATGIGVAAHITAADSGSELHLDGELQGTTDDFNYDFRLDANFREVANLPPALNPPQALEGKLTLRAVMAGSTDGFTLSDALFVLDNMPDYGLEAHGQMDYRFGGENTLLLTSSGELSSTEGVLDWLELDLRPLGRALGSATITGSLSHPVVENFILRSENDNGLTVNVQGSIDPQLGETEENRVRVDVNAPALATLEHWIGPLPHEPGEFSASGVIVEATSGVRLEEFVAESGSEETVLLRAEGTATSGDLSQKQGLEAIESMGLKLSLYAPDTLYLNPYLTQPLPPGFEVTGSVAVSGSGPELRLKDGEFRAESSDIVASLTPRSGTLRLLEEHILSGLEGDISVYLSDTSVLSQFFTAPVPVLGEVKGSARLAQHGQRFSLENVQLQVDNEEAALKASGRIQDLNGLQGLTLQNQFTGIRSRDLLETAFQNFHYSGELAQLSGKFKLLHNADGWSVTDLKVASTRDQTPLQLQAEGRLLNFTSTPSARLSMDFHLRDPALVEAISGLRTKPARGSVELISDTGVTTAGGRVRFDQSGFGFNGEVEHAGGKINSLVLMIDSPSVRLEDIGMQATMKPGGDYRPAEQLEELEPGQRFEKALRQAPGFDTDIAIEFDKVSGDNTNIEGFQLHFTGAQKRYTLRQFSLAYDSSLTEIRGIIDLNASPPFVSLAVDALAVPLDTLTKDLGIDFNISGIGNLRGGIASQGLNPEQLVASMDGNVGVALEDAIIDGAAYDVLATDLLAWFYSGAALEENTYVDCTMGQFVLKDGVASSDGLYIETGKMVATGSAMVDLGRRSMDVKFTPRSKSRTLQVPSSIRIRGKFDDPKVNISPVAAAVDAYAEMLTLVPRIAWRIFGGDHRRKKRRPCVPDST